MGQYGKNQSNTDIFRIGPIPVSPITTRSESARHFDNCKKKSREILDWLINKGIITWCFSYWSSYRSSVCCISVRLRLRPIQQASDLLLGQYEKHHVIIRYNDVNKKCLVTFHEKKKPDFSYPIRNDFIVGSYQKYVCFAS